MNITIKTIFGHLSIGIFHLFIVPRFLINPFLNTITVISDFTVEGSIKVLGGPIFEDRKEIMLLGKFCKFSIIFSNIH